MSLKLLFGVILGINFLVYSQSTQTIKGQVVDKESKYPLVGVTVLIQDVSPPIGAVTDAEGNFKLSEIPLGRLTLKISYLGFKELIMPNVVVTSGKETIINFQLEENITAIDEVVVKANDDKTATNNDMTVVSARSFNLEEATRYAGSRNDPARMAANFAGVSGANDGRNDIIIRGNSPLGILWRLDGVEIPNPNHFGSLGSTGGPVSMLNTNLLDKSDFMTGAFPANFGNATSGVFDLQYRKGNNEKREYLAQIGFNGFEFGAEGMFSKKYKGSFLINYRYSTLGIFKLIGVSFGTGAAVPQYQDLSFKLNFPTNKLGKFTVFGLGGLSYIELLDSKNDTTKANFYGNNGRDTYFGSNMGVVGASHTYFFNPSIFSKLVIAVSGTQNIIKQDSIVYDVPTKKYNPNQLELEYGNRFEQTKVTANFLINKKFNQRNSGNVGINIDRIGLNLQDSINLYQSATNSYRFFKIRDTQSHTFLYQAWAQLQHKFNERLTVNSGVHIQLFGLNNSWAIEPRLGIRYRINEKMTANLGAGIHNQIQPIMVYYQKIIATGENVNRSLGFTTSNQIVLGYDFNFAENWRIKSEVYYQNLQNIPVETMSSNFSMVNAGADFNFPGRESLQNKGTGYNYGVELTIEKFFSKRYYLLSTLSLYQSKYKGSDGVERNTAFNGNFVYNILGGYEFKTDKKGTLSIDGRMTFAGGKRHTPIDLAASKIAGKAIFIEDEAFSLQYKNYFRTDFKFAYRRDGKRVSQQWSVNIDNVFSIQNVFRETYDVNTNEIKQYFQLPLFIVPQYRILF